MHIPEPESLSPSLGSLHGDWSPFIWATFIEQLTWARSALGAGDTDMNENQPQALGSLWSHAVVPHKGVIFDP